MKEIMKITALSAITIGGVAMLISAIAFSSMYRILGTKTVITDTVVKTERIQTSDDSKYLIFGKKEVYENVDQLWYGKFNSSDFYRDIVPSKTYKFTVYGWRVPYFSWYRNIIGYEEVK